MKQIVVISGKGGTGKTVISAAFAALAENKIMVDCDVDAANLHLLLQPQVKERYEFKGGLSAVINKKLCLSCGKCIEVCRFSAIKSGFMVDRLNCEGCGFCAHMCPEGAIKMTQNISGEWFVSDTRFGQLVHAKLGIAEENSGKLVSLVRNRAREIAERDNLDWIIIDGAPGIGCPVIASLSGADCALVVAEPTLSGLHDALRVIEVSGHFKVPAKLMINKYDLNPKLSKSIEDYCVRNGIELVGKISFDKAVVEAVVSGKTVVEQGNTIVKQEITKVWERLKTIAG